LDFFHLPRNKQIDILENDKDIFIKVKYSKAFIPKNTLKIFTISKDGIIFKFYNKNVINYNEISKICEIINLPDIKLFN
jgi:hypothetical protein